MLSIPPAAEPLFNSFSVAFTDPTFQRILVLMIGGILAPGRHTITQLLWVMRSVARGHSSDYHRVFSRSPWSLWVLGRLLAKSVLTWVPADEPVLVAVDDTVAQHRGKRVYGKGCHHDAVRSAHRHVVFRWGHRWIVLAVLIQFPFSHRRWALPVLVALYRPQALDEAEGRRHRRAVELARKLMAVLIHWFPQRRFILLGDGGYAAHELARFCRRHRRHVTLVSRFRGDGRLYAPPPKAVRHKGRPRIKGRRLAAPKDRVARGPLSRTTVGWYGGSQRKVKLLSDTGYWYKPACGVIPIRWVYVEDAEGTHRSEYFYTTDADLAGRQIATLYTARWSIETTFQELRTHLGLETTRQWVAHSVLRAGPCLMGLFSVVCVIFARHVRNHRVPIRQTSWYTKPEPTFSDAIATVRRLFWCETIFDASSHNNNLKKIPSKLRNTLLDYLCYVA